jgi:predicted DNA-binding ribbon-helix-helix protein
MAGKKARNDQIPDAFRFVAGDILDLRSLAGKLNDPPDPFSQYISGSLQPETRELLNSFDGSKEATGRLAEALVHELNRIALDSAMFEARRFAHVESSEQARALIEARPEGKDLVRLNAMLIEEAYPQELLRNVSTVPKVRVERVQTGVRIEKKMLKVLKALAEFGDMTLGELIEDVVLHAFIGHSTFDTPESLERVAALKVVYGIEYDAHASYRFVERAPTA